MRRRPGHSRARITGILLLILAVLHAPMPQPDFHNIRHHDGPGQVCDHHDHLLRWHPEARQAEDVAILHWHWAHPFALPRGQDDRPGIHAHGDDWLATCQDSDPVVVPDASSTALRLVARSLSTSSPPSNLLLPPPWLLGDPGGGSSRLRTPSCALLAPGVPIPCLLQRWTC